MLDTHGRPRSAADEERASWWSDVSGIPPAGGVMLTDSMASGLDPALPGLRCLRELWEGDGEVARQVQQGVTQTRASLPRSGLPLVLIHGADDGLVPEAFSSGAYARWAKRQGRHLTYWRIANAQHFDAFLGLPPLATRYVPLLPYAYRALDAVWDHLQHGTAMPADADIETRRRRVTDSGIEPLTVQHLSMP
jgi:hydroxybutyrate-dimer hydrolase